MAMRSRILIIATGAALLAACETTQVDPGLGEALKYDMAIQTINPDPIYPPGATEPGSVGTTAAAAASRYRKGTVKPVERITTSQSSSGGGAGPN
jgi:hypothetical protein